MLRKLFLVISVAFAANATPHFKDRNLEVSLEPAATEVIPETFADPINGVEYRLPNHTFPIHYDISLNTNIHAGDFAFTGSVEILFGVIEATSEIILHHRQLTIHRVDLLTGTGNIIEENVIWSYEVAREFLTIPFPNALVVGTEYMVRITYGGTLRTDDAGFYRSSYINLNGDRVWLATTQFESTDARHGFPCFDEPGLSASYTIRIEHHNSYTALCNMPVESRTVLVETEFVVTVFEKSPNFQTYLVAFIISDFHYIENLAARTPQQVYATPNQIAMGYGDFALDTGVEVLEALEKYLEVDYLLPKIDQIAIPNFAAGAMENFGLVTYRETALLYSNISNTISRKLSVAGVISHEYAHQWFGNHVSPAWWSYLWLNEGFATLFESYATGLVFPSWREMETFVTATLHSVFLSDSLIGSRAMTHYVESPANINRLFDSVAYSKSGSVLRMLQHVCSVDTFSKGLRYYLNEMRGRGAVPEDLYRNLQIAVSEDFPGTTINIPVFMKTWELQAGYPVINVVRDGDMITLSQIRYMRDAGVDASNPLWVIPINYVVGSTPDSSITTPDFWMTERTMSLTSDSAPKSWTPNDWILFNIEQNGYYRVNYDDLSWVQLSNELVNGDYRLIHPVNRAQLIDDSFNLARDQKRTYKAAFDILAYLKHDADYIPWAAANRVLNYLHPFLLGSPYYQHFRQLMRNNVALLYSTVGYVSNELDTPLDKLLRNIAINWACNMGQQTCLTHMANTLSRVIMNQHVVEPDLESTVYCNGLRGTSQAFFVAFINRAEMPEHSGQKVLIMNSLGCSHVVSQINYYLNHSINGFYSSITDRRRVITAVYSNGGINGIQAVFNFLDQNMSAIASALTANDIGTIISNLASRTTNFVQYRHLVDILIKARVAGYISENTFNSYLNSPLDRLHWINRNFGPIEDWLRANVVMARRIYN